MFVDEIIHYLQSIITISCYFNISSCLMNGLQCMTLFVNSDITIY